ncbi:SET domain-containing protein [Chlamydia pneumoniae]|uniref:SET Domain protein n=1 Tax=Chlamydia pneumoniae TaxID=83558 RepID=A0A0F7X4Q0_CHLPN|nr:SET domain-containing protein-lysine N-methyltransferase [Chlamydia pneumoniae]AAD19016.1 SET Domain protein [Chlamydia pneumoniae CWL029]CRI33398.1 SET Domain protein [Chlamydia pneumoniae]CRI37388.1 SET Domain protein [Chlamydia pneumoniae]CRI38517.1 SET Domain protein [Chlamydia pneumoniae]CRI39649.1 SET Domain protein [Chlamydia pneumoniae]
MSTVTTEPCSSIHISLNNDWRDSQPYSLDRASELLHFRFLPSLVFSNWKVEQQIETLCHKSEKRRLISPLAKWLGKLHKQDLLCPPAPPVSVCWINAHVGYGVFARDEIAPWTYIGEYTGILRHRQAIWMDENDYCFRYPMPLFTLRYFTIDSGKQGNVTRFINHSEQPNAEAIGVFSEGLFHVIIRTVAPIYAGQEICYHYGPLYWKHRKKREEFIPEEE